MVKYELFSRQPQQNGPSHPQQPGVLENLRKIILQKQNTKNLLQIPSSRVTFLLSTLQEIIHTQTDCSRIKCAGDFRRLLNINRGI